jgi:hypothetical protein
MSPGPRGRRESKIHDRRTDPDPARSAPAPPGCRTPCACRWHPPPATLGCPPADRSSQHFDNLPQRLGADLAAQTHPPPTPRRDLDDALAIRPPRPTVIGRDLDRHPLFYQNRVFIPRAPPPCAVRRDRWFRSRLGPSARPKTGPPASGRCWNNDHRQPVFGLRRARPRRARFRR